ncbi:hypothetical protein ACLF3G_14935 [Falsiroseomonas sp. HC035]|uniref:hypothetical protein n=1 Tax=Falsiroseomonas sp. HC035 TaxID=3390999 RepID=UPI003D319CE3
MRIATKLATAALALAAMTATSGSASAHEWNHSARTWHHSSVPSCTLRLESIVQDNPGQPLRVVITNTSHTRLRYNVSIEIQRGGGQGTALTEIRVDNANAGERSTATSLSAVSGSMQGSRVTLRVTSCSIRT